MNLMFLHTLQTLILFCLLRLFRPHTPLYDVFLVPGVKLTDAITARLSGGVTLLVRKELSRFVDQSHTEHDNVIICTFQGVPGNRE